MFWTSFFFHGKTKPFRFRIKVSKWHKITFWTFFSNCFQNVLDVSTWSRIGPEVLPGPQKVFFYSQTTSEVIFKKSRKIEISTVKSIFSTWPCERSKKHVFWWVWLQNNIFQFGDLGLAKLGIQSSWPYPKCNQSDFWYEV